MSNLGLIRSFVPRCLEHHIALLLCSLLEEPHDNFRFPSYVKRRVTQDVIRYWYLNLVIQQGV